MIGRSILMAAAALAAVAGSGAGFGAMNVAAVAGASERQIDKNNLPAQGQKRNTLQALFGSGMGATYNPGRRAGPGWTNRHARRVARKKRNQARHRSAGRGRSRA